MEAAFEAGQAWLVNLASLATLAPRRKAGASYLADLGFRAGRLPIASASLVGDEDEDDELELDDDLCAEYSHTLPCDGLGTMPDSPPGDGKD